MPAASSEPDTSRRNEATAAREAGTVAAPGVRPKDLVGGLAPAALIGISTYGLTRVMNVPVADPLVLAMLAGVFVRTVLGHRMAWKKGFAAAPALCIPVGIAFYAVKNLNFIEFAAIPKSSVMLAALIVLVYFAVIRALGRLLGQKQEITYLTATGSAICGASAIAITSPAVKADCDDISVSILAVTVAAVVALFTVLPFVAVTFGLTDHAYGLLSGSVLQMTGFVKAAVHNEPFLNRQLSDEALASLALSVKAARYLGLLIAIPVFASLVRKRLYLPWVLWVFLAAGVLGSWVYATREDFYTATLIPAVKPMYGLSWSIAMAAVGLNVDVRKLASNQGIKALIAAFAGCAAAVATFFAGWMILGYR